MTTPMAPQVQADSEITLEYTLSTEHDVVDTTEGLKPLSVKLGTGALHPAIESCLLGLSEGDAFERTIHHTLAFGERDTQLRFKVKRARLPAALREAAPGVSFEAPGPDGRKRLFRILQGDETSVLIDGNHPLAGIDLHLEGRVLRVR